MDRLTSLTLSSWWLAEEGDSAHSTQQPGACKWSRSEARDIRLSGCGGLGALGLWGVGMLTYGVGGHAVWHPRYPYRMVNLIPRRGDKQWTGPLCSAGDSAQHRRRAVASLPGAPIPKHQRVSWTGSGMCPWLRTPRTTMTTRPLIPCSLFPAGPNTDSILQGWRTDYGWPLPPPKNKQNPWAE